MFYTENNKKLLLMKKIFYFLFFIILLTSASYHQVFAQTEKTVIKVGAYDNYPKIFQDENGDWQGIFPDILQSVANKQNWQIEYIAGTWTDDLKRLEEGQIDIMVDVAYSDERAALYDFSNEPVLINWGIIYQPKNADIHSFPDLKDKTIAVMRDSIHTTGPGGIKDILDKFDINVKYLEVDDYAAVFAALDGGTADAGVVNRLYGATFEKKYRIKKTPIIINPNELKFAFPKGATNNARLVAAIDQELFNLKKDANSIYYQSTNKYLNEAEELNWYERIPAAIKVIIVIGGLSLVVFLSFSIILRQQVSFKTKELHKLNKVLQEKIKDQEKIQKQLKRKERELETKIYELNKFSDALIGRQSKISELKKVIKQSLK